MTNPSVNLNIRPFRLSDEAQVVELWKLCGLAAPQNNPHRDIRRKLAVQSELFLVASTEEAIIATVMAGYEGHRGWINYLAVHPEHQGRGLGRRMMEEAERLLRAAGCPKINLQVRRSNTTVIDFYERLGYNQDDVVSLGKRLEFDS